MSLFTHLPRAPRDLPSSLSPAQLCTPTWQPPHYRPPYSQVKPKPPINDAALEHPLSPSSLPSFLHPTKMSGAPTVTQAIRPSTERQHWAGQPWSVRPPLIKQGDAMTACGNTVSLLWALARITDT